MCITNASFLPPIPKLIIVCCRQKPDPFAAQDHYIGQTMDAFLTPGAMFNHGICCSALDSDYEALDKQTPECMSLFYFYNQPGNNTITTIDSNTIWRFSIIYARPYLIFRIVSSMLMLPDFRPWEKLQVLHFLHLGFHLQSCIFSSKMVCPLLVQMTLHVSKGLWLTECLPHHIMLQTQTIYFSVALKLPEDLTILLLVSCYVLLILIGIIKCMFPLHSGMNVFW